MFWGQGTRDDHSSLNLIKCVFDDPYSHGENPRLNTIVSLELHKCMCESVNQ